MQLRSIFILTTVFFACSSQATEQEPGKIFIDDAASKQKVEFIGEGNRPVNNTMVDKHSIYQDKDRIAPTEFGTGVKYNATDDFSISVQAGGEVINNEAIEVDSGSVLFELNF